MTDRHTLAIRHIQREKEVMSDRKDLKNTDRNNERQIDIERDCQTDILQRMERHTM